MQDFSDNENLQEQGYLTIKDIARLMRVTTETIRFYERKNIITPKRSRFNDYRYFDQIDIRKLFDLKTYQELGFSVSEVADVFSKSSEEDLNDMLEVQAVMLQRKMEQQILAIERMKHIQAAIDLYKQYNGQFFITFSPHWLTCYHSPGSVFCRENAEHRFWDLIASDFNSFTTTAHIPLAIAHNRDCNKHMDRGYSIPYEKGTELGLSPDEVVTEYLPCRCAYTVIQAEPVVNGDSLQPVFDWIRARNLRACGDVFCTVNMITFNRDEESRIYEVWIPVEDI